MLYETIKQSGMLSCTIDGTVIDTTSQKGTFFMCMSFNTAIPHYPRDTHLSKGADPKIFITL